MYNILPFNQLLNKTASVLALSCALALSAGVCVSAQDQSNRFSAPSNPLNAEDYNIEFPPMPDILVDGQWFSWEEVYGPLSVAPSPAESLSEISIEGSPSRVQAAALRAQTIAPEIPPYTRSFANPATRRSSLIDYPPTRIDFVRLKELTEIHQNNGSSSTNLALTLILSDDYNSNKRVGITQSVTNTFTLDYTCFKIKIDNVPADEEVEVFFSESASSGKWIPTILSCVGIDNSTNTRTNIVTVAGHHSSGFFAAALVCDSDEDGLSDAVEELVFKSNPNNPDSNFLYSGNNTGTPSFPNKGNNGICDGDEDLDGDGWSNADEISMMINPFISNLYSEDDNFNGLPDWVERNIFLLLGILNPALLADSDGDGVNNHLELALHTDPTVCDKVYNSSLFENLPDEKRAFSFPPITVSSEALPPGLLTNDLYCVNAGVLGSFLHLELNRDKVMQNGSLVASIGQDTLFIKGAYLTPGNFPAPVTLVGQENASLSELSTCYLSPKILLDSYLQLVNQVWSYEYVQSGVLDSCGEIEFYLVSQVARNRMILFMRKLQLCANLAADLSTQSPVMQQRIRNLVSSIYNDARLFHRACTECCSLRNQIPSFLCTSCIKINSTICFATSMIDDTRRINYYTDIYVRDVARGFDGCADSAHDLSVSIQTLIGDIANGFAYLANTWIAFYDILSDFDGHSTSAR